MPFCIQSLFLTTIAKVGRVVNSSIGMIDGTPNVCHINTIVQRLLSQTFLLCRVVLENNPPRLDPCSVRLKICCAFRELSDWHALCDLILRIQGFRVNFATHADGYGRRHALPSVHTALGEVGIEGIAAFHSFWCFAKTPDHKLR